MKLKKILTLAALTGMIGTISYTMEQQQEIRKHANEPLAQTFQLKSLTEQSIKTVAEQINQLIDRNQFDNAIKKIKLLPDELKYQIIVQLIKYDLRNKSGYYWNEISREIVNTHSKKLNRFLLKLAEQITFDGLAELIQFQIVSLAIVEGIKNRKQNSLLFDSIIPKINLVHKFEEMGLHYPSTYLRRQIGILLQKINSPTIQALLNQFLAHQISESEMKSALSHDNNPVQLLLQLPWNLIIVLLETILAEGPMDTIWLDSDHTIPDFKLGRQAEDIESLQSIFEELLQTPEVTVPQKHSLIQLLSKFETTLYDMPWLAEFALLAAAGSSNILNLLINSASKSSQFDALYFLTFLIISLKRLPDEFVEKTIAAVDLLLKSGINSFVKNKEGKTLLQILNEWKQAGNDTVTLKYDGKETQYTFNRSNLEKIIELLQKYAGLTETTNQN